MTEGIINGGRVARVVLLACGSYNPITNMHLRMFGRFRLIAEHCLVIEILLIVYFFDIC